MSLIRNPRVLGAALSEMLGVWIVVGILCTVAVLAIMNPPSREIGIAYGIFAIGAVIYSGLRTWTKAEKLRL